MLPLDDVVPGAGRPLVEVAVDAPAGPGPRTYTYVVPVELGDLEAGEAVLVPFGKGGRQAIGIVLGPGVEPAAGPAGLRPVAARVRSDGPLLPPLALSLARAPIGALPRPARGGDPGDAAAGHARAARARGRGHTGRRGEDRAPGARSPGRGARPARRAGRAGATGARPVDARGTCGAPAPAARARRGGPRRADLDAARGGARAAVRATALAHGRRSIGGHGPRARGTDRGPTAGSSPACHPRGPGDCCTRRACDERSARRRTAGRTPSDALAGPAVDDGAPAAPLAERHGASSIASLVRRGLVRAEVRERPRRPLALRPVGLRGARPAGAPLTPDQQAALSVVRAAIEQRDPTPTLLDGVTGGGKTAIYVEAIAASLAAGTPSAAAGPGDRPRHPDRGPAPCRPPDPDRGRPLGAGGGGAGGRVAADPRRGRGPRRGDADRAAGAALGRRAHRRGRGARSGVQERPDPAVPGAGRSPASWRRWRARRWSSAARRRPWRAWATRGPAGTVVRCFRCGPPAPSRA